MTEVTSPVRVHMRHLRAEKVCSGGGRTFFKQHGFDWADFLANGIEADVLAATGNAFALLVAERARAEFDG